VKTIDLIFSWASFIVLIVNILYYL